MLTITEDAAKKIKSIIDEENADLKLRISVQGGGCSGFQYGFSLEDLPPAEDDLTFEKNGIEIVVDAMSLQYMDDAEIDYKSDFTSSQFVIRNPTAKASCGCGSSFTV